MCLLVYYAKWFKNRKKKGFVLYGTGWVYFMYMNQQATSFVISNEAWNLIWGTDSSWTLVLIFVVAAPMISLLFIGLPPVLISELVLCFLIVFVVIIPLVSFVSV